MSTGPTGPRGLQGPQGFIGPQGLPGNTGPTGPGGIQGFTGDIGPTGPEGLPGLPGIDGVTGPTGAAGPSGTLATAILSAINGSATLVIGDVSEPIVDYTVAADIGGGTFVPSAGVYVVPTDGYYNISVGADLTTIALGADTTLSILVDGAPIIATSPGLLATLIGSQNVNLEIIVPLAAGSAVSAEISSIAALVGTTATNAYINVLRVF